MGRVRDRVGARASVKIPSTMPPIEDWVILPTARVVELYEGSRLRDGHGGRAGPQHKAYNPTSSLHDVNFRGDLGEEIYAITTGQVMNEKVRLGGFKGDDFPDGINVKSTRGRDEDTCLIVTPGLVLPTLGYACVTVDEAAYPIVGAVLGWATVAEILGSRQKDYGRGLRHSIHHTLLHLNRRALSG